MLEQLEVAIVQWAHDKGIMSHGTPVGQIGKTEEEVAELREAIEQKNLEGIIDGIGDSVVTLIIQAHMHGLTLGQCLATAYLEIANRKGKMENGVFVKDE